MVSQAADGFAAPWLIHSEHKLFDRLTVTAATLPARHRDRTRYTHPEPRQLGKASQVHERGIELTVTVAVELPPNSLDARDLVAADGELIITIADSGQGIDTDEIDAFFHLGASAKAAPAGSGGRGFWRVLVRQAVTRLGGDLEVDSDGGAIFTVTLPLTGGGNDGE